MANLRTRNLELFAIKKLVNVSKFPLYLLLNFLNLNSRDEFKLSSYPPCLRPSMISNWGVSGSTNSHFLKIFPMYFLRRMRK